MPHRSEVPILETPNIHDSASFIAEPMLDPVVASDHKGVSD